MKKVKWIARDIRFVEGRQLISMWSSKPSPLDENGEYDIPSGDPLPEEGEIEVIHDTIITLLGEKIIRPGECLKIAEFKARIADDQFKTKQMKYALRRR